MNKRTTLIIIILAMASVIISACATGANAQGVIEENAPKRTVSVNGVGEIQLTPELATISIGVHSEDKNASEAVAENNGKAQAVKDALLSFEIAVEDIQTANFSIYPRQEWGENSERIGITYVVENTVMVTVRDLEAIGEILDAVVKAGANNIGGIQFDVADRNAAYDQALEAAVLNARSRAETIAGAADITLGDVQSINTFISTAPYPVERTFAMEAMGGGDIAISPGAMTISVEVSAVFEIH